jgi:hypothetical protein
MAASVFATKKKTGIFSGFFSTEVSHQKVVYFRGFFSTDVSAVRPNET